MNAAALGTCPALPAPPRPPLHGPHCSPGGMPRNPAPLHLHRRSSRCRMCWTCGRRRTLASPTREQGRGVRGAYGVQRLSSAGAMRYCRATCPAPAPPRAAPALRTIQTHPPAPWLQHRGHVGPQRQARVLHFIPAPRRGVQVRLEGSGGGWGLSLGCKARNALRAPLLMHSRIFSLPRPLPPDRAGPS